jgi:hypothetical protein
MVLELIARRISEEIPFLHEFVGLALILVGDGVVHERTAVDPAIHDDRDGLIALGAVDIGRDVGPVLARDLDVAEPSNAEDVAADLVTGRCG